MSSCEPFLEWQCHQTVNLGSCLPGKIRQGDHEPSIHRHSRTVSTCILRGITELWKGQGFSPERFSPLKFSVHTAVILIGTKHSKRTTDKGYGYKITKKSVSHKHLEKVFSITKLRCISLLNVYCCQNTNSYCYEETLQPTLSHPVDSLFYFQFSSVTQSCLTICDPMNHSTPGLPVHHQLLESTPTHVHRVGDAIQPSHPLSFPSPPALNLSQHQGLFESVSSFH